MDLMQKLCDSLPELIFFLLVMEERKLPRLKTILIDMMQCSIAQFKMGR
jgi:hypothetical protein